MKAVAAILVFALCNSATLVQGGIIGDVANTAVNTVSSLLQNLVGILEGLNLPLPDITVGLNAQ